MDGHPGSRFVAVALPALRPINLLPRIHRDSQGAADDVGVHALTVGVGGAEPGGPDDGRVGALRVVDGEQRLQRAILELGTVQGHGIAAQVDRLADLRRLRLSGGA